MAGFLGHGGACVASCFNKKCAEMRREVAKRRHAMCVTYFPESDELFALNWGWNLCSYARDAPNVYVITGDRGELGEWQRKEISFMEEKKIRYEKLTLRRYTELYPAPAGALVHNVEREQQLPPAPLKQKRQVVRQQPGDRASKDAAATALLKVMIANRRSPSARLRKATAYGTRTLWQKMGQGNSASSSMTSDFSKVPTGVLAGQRPQQRPPSQYAAKQRAASFQKKSHAEWPAKAKDTGAWKAPRAGGVRAPSASRRVSSLSGRGSGRSGGKQGSCCMGETQHTLFLRGWEPHEEFAIW